MTESVVSRGIISEVKSVDQNRLKKMNWWGLTAFIGFAGGILSSVIGLLMSGIGHIAGANEIDSKIGTILVFLSFPLMMLGAHALDKRAETREKKTNKD